jgi:hypothetical protein
VFRPDLTGPFTSELQIAFAGAAQVELVAPGDPARASREPAAGGRPPHYRIEGSGAGGEAPTAWAIAAGPHFLEPKLAARAGGLGSGGVAVLLAFRGAADYAFVELRPGAPARLLRVDGGGQPDARCAGAAVDPAAIDATAVTPALSVTVGDGRLVVELEGTALLACELDAPLPAGLVGIGVLGGDGAAVRIEQIAALR